MRHTTAIAASTAQNDAGVFEFSFRDERYMPFEGAGAINSEWNLALPRDFRTFDYQTISDVILRISYTAEEDPGLRTRVQESTNEIANNIKNYLSDTGVSHIFSMRHEFATDWYKFLHPSAVGAEQILNFTLGKERFPFFAQDRDIVVMKVELFAKCTQATDYHALLSYFRFTDDPVTDEPVTSTSITMQQSDAYGGLNTATIDVNDAGLNLEELDIAKKMSLKLKRSTAGDYTGLVTEPQEVEDVFFVVHYKLRT